MFLVYLILKQKESINCDLKKKVKMLSIEFKQFRETILVGGLSHIIFLN